MSNQGNQGQKKAPADLTETLANGLQSIKPLQTKKHTNNPAGAPREADGELAVYQTSRQEYVRRVLESPGEDNYLARLPEAQRNKIARSHLQIKTGTAIAGPLWCFGPKKCPFYSLCPLASFDADGEVVEAPFEDHPIGRPCVVEDAYMRNQVIEYLEQLQVDHGNAVEMAIVRELALIDLQKQRALNILSVGDKRGQGRDFMLEVTNPIGVSPQGEVLEVTQTQLHPLHDLLDKLENRRQRWLTKLLATRKDRVDAQAKLGQKEESQQLNDTILDMAAYLKSLNGKQVQTGATRVIPIED
jgi:hypothetical protein